jgi:urea transport system ATP-binding protein
MTENNYNLMVDGVGVNFSGFQAVSNFSMVVEQGEMRVLLGANGAGKTTLMDMICGKTQSTEGRIFIGDTEITNKPPHTIARMGVGRKFQIPSVFKELTVRQNLSIAAMKNTSVFSNLGSLKRRIHLDKLEETLELINLTRRAEDLAGNLSHGETQWLELGLLVILNPKIILLDEPTAGMTADETLKTSRIVNDLKGRHTIVAVEHDMAFVREIADKITVMHQGKFLAEGRIGDIEKSQAVKDAYLGSGGIA